MDLSCEKFILINTPGTGFVLDLSKLYLGFPISQTVFPKALYPCHLDPRRREKFNFYFHTLLWCWKGFMASVKPFEAPQRTENKNLS